MKDLSGWNIKHCDIFQAELFKDRRKNIYINSQGTVSEVAAEKRLRIYLIPGSMGIGKNSVQREF